MRQVKVISFKWGGSVVTNCQCPDR